MDKKTTEQWGMADILRLDPIGHGRNFYFVTARYAKDLIYGFFVWADDEDSAKYRAFIRVWTPNAAFANNEKKLSAYQISTEGQTK